MTQTVRTDVASRNGVIAIRELGLAAPGFRHLISTEQASREWIDSNLFPLCDYLRLRGTYDDLLKGRSVYFLFYEPSFLTRTSFERATELLGGQAYHTEDASQFFPIHSLSQIDNILSILASLRFDLTVLRSSESGVMQDAEQADALPVINGGGVDDHPTQALADLYTIHHELGGIDGCTVAVVGRLEHRNVSALLKGLASYENVKVLLLPFSGKVSPQIRTYCDGRGVQLIDVDAIDALADADAIYLNGPRTVAHAQLLKSRNALNIRIDESFMSMLRPHCVVMDPMQRSGDFEVEVTDSRLAFYRQSANALAVRMAVLLNMLAVEPGNNGVNNI